MAADAGAPRDKQFLLAPAEQAVLHWVAARLPRRVLPDHLTVLGILAAVGIAVAYALSSRDPAWLWLASGLLVVHWLGDSLDGTLARQRGIERPRYGYYLDHLVDAAATACIGIGLGLSPHMLMITGLIVVVAYLLLSINTYLETHVFGVFTLGYGRLGPTEARLALVALNLAVLAGVPLRPLDGLVLSALDGLVLSALDVVGLAAAAVMVAALAIRAARNLRELALREPPATPRPA